MTTATVRALVVHGAGDVRLEERPAPVPGAGPIGLLVVAALRRAGAAEVVVTDVAPEPLAQSSGSPAGLATCLRGVRRQGRVVVLGLLPPGDVPFPGNLVVPRELELVGTFRLDGEIHDVLQAFADGSLPAAPVITHVLPLADAAGALELAADPRRSGKVLLDLTGGAPAGTTP